MRRSLVTAAVFAALLSFTAGAQNIFDFDDWMQRIDDGSQELQRHISTRDRDAAVAAARELEELYGLMEKFFDRRDGAGDAVRWSREGRKYASQALRDLEAQKFSAARRNALAIAHGCRDCHVNYKPL